MPDNISPPLFPNPAPPYPTQMLFLPFPPAPLQLSFTSFHQVNPHLIKTRKQSSRLAKQACPIAFTALLVYACLSCLGFVLPIHRPQGQELIFCTMSTIAGNNSQLLTSTSVAYVIKCQLACGPILLLLTVQQKLYSWFQLLKKPSYQKKTTTKIYTLALKVRLLTPILQLLCISMLLNKRHAYPSESAI